MFVACVPRVKIRDGLLEGKEEEIERTRGDVRSLQEAWRIDPAHLSLNKFVAAGGEGRVYRGTWRRQFEVAVKMMKRDNDPGSLEALRTRTWTYMLDKHQRQVQDARRKGETPPQEPSIAKRDRTMFSHCIFNLEDTVLDCVDTKLRELGWRVDSLIYDGVS